MSKITKKDILDFYNDLCVSANKKFSRNEYRKIPSPYSSSLIESIWGSWSNFNRDAQDRVALNRTESTKIFDKSVNNIVITYAFDGADIDTKAFDILRNYCKINQAELGILWGKSITRDGCFDKATYDLLSPYLATRFKLNRDKGCLIQDFLISHTQRNPLMNIDRISSDFNTVVIGSAKQFLKILPYHPHSVYRVDCSTGTISSVDYKNTVAGHIDKQCHTFGAILLTWDENKGRYITRNLRIVNNELCDLNNVYTADRVYKRDVDTIVLGDLHLPEEDQSAVKASRSLIKKLSPKYVLLHDVASWQSISHHELTKYLTKLNNETKDTQCLKTEISTVIKHLSDLTKSFPNVSFKIVNSNHDDFVSKWLDEGEFVKDPKNAEIGAHLFIDYLHGNKVLTAQLPDNVKYLPLGESFTRLGYELSEHGHKGLAGAKGNSKVFNRTFSKSVVGHTHSPEIFENSITVGTLSKLILAYNKTGLTNWAHCNCIITSNGSFQLIFV